ncbi:hypothetical protein CLV30_110160 [Haloactinopolyspora alba]|uniref:Uncharacterized protein n=1 Tax=Haloactinopolyspora alba TaxID=648780 RepID=A0A2P8DZ61_9ACTN|nr:hypothetical protein CLV30_110160 [Haloactinopolyspora alba]
MTAPATTADVIVRYDPDQVNECVITGEDGKTVVTFGPNLPTGHEHGETMLMHILRVLVAPDWGDDE